MKNGDKCCICNRPLERFNPDYLCNWCDTKYADYENDEPTIQKIHRKKKKRPETDKK